MTTVDEARATLLDWVARSEIVADPAGHTIYDELRLTLLPALIAAVRAEYGDIVVMTTEELRRRWPASAARIEAEARAAALDEARAAVEAMFSWDIPTGEYLDREDVLAAIDALRESGDPAEG